MSPEVIAILGVGVCLAVLILSGQRSLLGRMDRLEAAMHSLGERVARLEGAVPFLVPPPSAGVAVARPSKPHGG